MSDRNYHRFYASLQRISVGDAEEMKETLVSSFTEGRTTHLHEMTDAEYAAMCEQMEERVGWKTELKKKRSESLKLMQQLGVDTTDWAQINDFCRHPRICGKAFGQLSIDELMELATKLRSIKRKGWQRKKSEPAKAPETPQQRITYFINLAAPGMTSYN